MTHKIAYKKSNQDVQNSLDIYFKQFKSKEYLDMMDLIFLKELSFQNSWKSTGKWQSLLLKPLNIQNYPIKASRKYLEILADCFLSICANPNRFKNDVLVEFQTELILNMAVSFKYIFDAHGIDSSLISNFVASSFASEHKNQFILLDNIDSSNTSLIYARFKFLIFLLRIFLTKGYSYSLPLRLPIICQFLNTVMSVQIPSHKSSREIINLMSLLTHFYAVAFKIFDNKMLPNLGNVVTLLAYQFDWTCKWDEAIGEELNELIKFRLALHNLMNSLLITSRGVSSSRVIDLLPKIFRQVNLDISKIISHKKTQLPNFLSLNLLLSHLIFLKKVFKLYKGIFKTQLLCREKKQQSINLLSQFDRTCIHLISLISKVNENSEIKELFHPMVLTTIIEIVSDSYNNLNSCSSLVVSFISSLVDHFDPTVREAAQRSLMNIDEKFFAAIKIKNLVENHENQLLVDNSFNFENQEFKYNSETKSVSIQTDTFNDSVVSKKSNYTQTDTNISEAKDNIRNIEPKEILTQNHIAPTGKREFISIELQPIEIKSKKIKRKKNCKGLDTPFCAKDHKSNDDIDLSSALSMFNPNFL